MWHLPREIFDLAIKSLSKVRLKKQRVIAEKKDFKWEISRAKWETDIKDILKQNSMYLEIKCPFLNDECI